MLDSYSDKLFKVILMNIRNSASNEELIHITKTLKNTFTLDVEGMDAKFKLCIITGHAYGLFLGPGQVFPSKTDPHANLAPSNSGLTTPVRCSTSTQVL